MNKSPFEEKFEAVETEDELLHKSVRQYKVLGIFLLVVCGFFGLIFGLMISTKLVEVFQAGQWITFEEPYVLLFTGAVGIPGVIAGLHLFLHKIETIIDPGQVHIKRQGLFGPKYQSVPLSEYRGIVYRIKLYKLGLIIRYKGFNIVHRHTLELSHRKDKNKNVMLRISDYRRGDFEEKSAMMLRILKRYCRKTGLPGIDEHGSEPEMIQVEE